MSLLKKATEPWLSFAEKLFAWAKGYERIEVHSWENEDGFHRKGAEDLAEELEFGCYDEKKFDAFLKHCADAIKKVIVIIPKILMSDKRDHRYDQIVRDFWTEHPEVFLSFWLELRKVRLASV